MPVSYDQDIVAWAAEQARLIRAGQFDKLDIEHIAEEVESVGKSEQRELLSRMSVLIAHLLKWLYQPGYRGRSWTLTIKEQRLKIGRLLKEAPSMKGLLVNAEWLGDAWQDGALIAEKETGLEVFPASPIWTADQMLAEGWLPDVLEG